MLLPVECNVNGEWKIDRGCRCFVGKAFQEALYILSYLCKCAVSGAVCGCTDDACVNDCCQRTLIDVNQRKV